MSICPRICLKTTTHNLVAGRHATCTSLTFGVAHRVRPRVRCSASVDMQHIPYPTSLSGCPTTNRSCAFCSAVNFDTHQAQPTNLIATRRNEGMNVAVASLQPFTPHTWDRFRSGCLYHNTRGNPSPMTQDPIQPNVIPSHIPSRPIPHPTLCQIPIAAARSCRLPRYMLGLRGAVGGYAPHGPLSPPARGASHVHARRRAGRRNGEASPDQVYGPG